MKNSRNAESVSNEADGAEKKGESKEKAISELVHAFQACTELRTLNRALKGFSVDIGDGGGLDVDDQRELDTLIDWLERTENSLDASLGLMTVNLGLQREDLPLANSSDNGPPEIG